MKEYRHINTVVVSCVLLLLLYEAFDSKRILQPSSLYWETNDGSTTTPVQQGRENSQRRVARRSALSRAPWTIQRRATSSRKRSRRQEALRTSTASSSGWGRGRALGCGLVLDVPPAPSPVPCGPDRTHETIMAGETTAEARPRRRLSLAGATGQRRYHVLLVSATSGHGTTEHIVWYRKTPRIVFSRWHRP